MKVTILTSPNRSVARESQSDFSTFSRKDISWADSSDRKWLMNHLHWAMHNNQSVRLLPHSESN